MDNEEFRVANTKKKSLLEKYDISLENLSYEYISSCKNDKELERIIRILRSGEEGYYPDLTKNAEDKLASINPNSSILRVATPVITKNMLQQNDRKMIDDDIINWMQEMKIQEKDLNSGKAINKNEISSIQPEIRKFQELHKNIKSTSKQKKEQRIASCDYASWDKYDADTELTRIDLHEQQKQVLAKCVQQEEKEKFRKMKKDNIFEKMTLTGTELNVIAKYEREKGNEVFRAGDYEEALQCYNSSIAMDGDVLAYNNRAITHIKLGLYDKAIKDCNYVLSIEDNNVKALLRRAVALEHLQKKNEALADYETVLILEPTNKLAIQAINRLDGTRSSKAVRMKIEDEFEKKEMKNSQNIIKTYASFFDFKTYYPNNELSKMCFCKNAPGPSRHIDPLPHFKSDYCNVENELKLINEPNQSLNVIKSSKSMVKKCSEVVIQEISDNDKTSLIQSLEISNINKENGDCLNIDSTMQNDTNINIEEDSKHIVGDIMQKKLEIQKKENEITGSKKKWETIKGNEQSKGFGVIKGSEQSKEAENKFINDIRSPYEFMRAWKALKQNSNLELHAQLLRSITPEVFVKVAGSNLDSLMFNIILQCLEKYFCQKSDVDLMIRYLKSFTQLNRFSIILMFLDSYDKKALSKIFAFLEENGVDEIENLRQKYN